MHKYAKRKNIKQLYIFNKNYIVNRNEKETMKEKIICDTRERLPLWKNKDIIVRKLDAGDYSIEGTDPVTNKPYEEIIGLERKSIADAYGTFGRGHDRFKRELERAKDFAYFAIVIEGSYSRVLDKDFPMSHKVFMKGESLVKIASMLEVKYGVPVHYFVNRLELKKWIITTFDCFVRYRTQLAIDLNKSMSEN